MSLPPGVYRADHIGSFLRPASVKQARSQQSSSSTASAVTLRLVEDAAIDKLVQQQLAAGLRSITDGELRRAWFHVDFLQKLGGIEMRGTIESVTASSTEGKSPPRLVVTGRLEHKRPIQEDDYRFLEGKVKEYEGDYSGSNDKDDAKGGVDRERSYATPKICIPSPTMAHFRGGRASIDLDSYPDMDKFFADLARVYQEELADLYAAGARFVQMDDTNLAYLCDPKMRDQVTARNEDPALLPRLYAELINDAISKRPADLKIGVHLCRGNYRSQWFASGGYEPVAEVLFKELNVDAYFLEYDDARSGDFAPLRFLPENKIVVLGLMSSKKADLDDKETIIKRLKEAAAICPKGLDQLCLSHQCGFSSTEDGNDLTEDEQWAKVKLEVEIAKEVWGDDLSK